MSDNPWDAVRDMSAREISELFDRNLIIVAAARRLYEARKVRDAARKEKSRVNMRYAVKPKAYLDEPELNITTSDKPDYSAPECRAAHRACLSAGAKLAAATRAFNRVMEDTK